MFKLKKEYVYDFYIKNQKIAVGIPRFDDLKRTWFEYGYIKDLNDEYLILKLSNGAGYKQIYLDEIVNIHEQ